MKLLTMCIFLSVEKKKAKKEVVVVSTAGLKRNLSFAWPIMQYDHRTLSVNGVCFPKRI